MDAKTLNALKGSIKKWEGVVKGTVKDEGPDNCPLCQRFQTHDGCAGCPVSIKTKEDWCLGSPYYDYVELEDSALPDEKAISLAAKKELAFLKRLLPRKSVKRSR